MNKLSFKEYYESKISLLKESEKPVVFKTTHTFFKYTKAPLSVNHHKSYISFKPKDIALVEWYRSGDVITPLSITHNNVSYSIVWNNTKMKNWIEQSSTQNL